MRSRFEPSIILKFKKPLCGSLYCIDQGAAQVVVEGGEGQHNHKLRRTFLLCCGVFRSLGLEASTEGRSSAFLISMCSNNTFEPRSGSDDDGGRCECMY